MSLFTKGGRIPTGLDNRVPDMPRPVPTPNPRPPSEQRLQYLEKQNAALLKALMKKDDSLLQTIIEQQKQILNLTAKLGELVERDRLRERQLRFMWEKVK